MVIPTKMEGGQGVPSPLDEASPVNMESGSNPDITHQDTDDTPVGHVVQPSVNHEEDPSRVSDIENGPVLAKVNGKTPTVEEDAELPTQSADGIENNKGSILEETNRAAINGTGNVEAPQAGKDVHFQEDAQGESGGQHEEVPRSGPSVGKNKKKKKKPKSQRGLNAPTGFEEYYVDAPLTPEEHAEERDLYDQSNPFVVRIETAIQRYRTRRNMDSDKRNLFDKWLTFGGVDSRPRQFTGGVDSQMLAESSAGEIAAFTAVNFVNSDMDVEGPDAKYEVDFDGVVRGFLASRLDKLLDTSTKAKVDGWCNIIRNFMNYLLHHDVCPEYNDQIYAARESCDLAAKQIWSCHEAITALPGDFGMACSTLFGGFYYDTYDPDAQLRPGSETSMFGMSKARARNVFEFGLTAHCDDALFNRYQTQVAEKKVSMESLGELGLEVMSIEMPGEDVQRLYANLPTLEPSGIMRAKSWPIPGTEATKDLSPAERLAKKKVKEVAKEYEFWIEESVLKKLFVGMKLVVNVREMSFSVLYMDNCLNAHCSFFEILPNELMLGYRPFRYLEPKVPEVWNDEQGKVEPEQAPDRNGEDEENGGGDQSGEQAKPESKALDEKLAVNGTGGQEPNSEEKPTSNGNQDAPTTEEEAPPKWHYEEIDGELCFVPYEEPVHDDESDLDDDDKIHGHVNNHTSVTAYDWGSYSAPTSHEPTSATGYTALNPDTDPATMRLDTWAGLASPGPDPDPESSSDDESKKREYVHESELATSAAQTGREAVREADPKTPAKLPHSAVGSDGENENDEDIDISPQTEKHSVAMTPRARFISNVQDWRSDMEEQGKWGVKEGGGAAGAGDGDGVGDAGGAEDKEGLGENADEVVGSGEHGVEKLVKELVEGRAKEDAKVDNKGDAEPGTEKDVALHLRGDGL